MRTLERNLRRARACFIGSTILFTLFCLAGTGPGSSVLPVWAAETQRHLAQPLGISAWVLMCVAYDLRRRAF